MLTFSPDAKKRKIELKSPIKKAKLNPGLAQKIIPQVAHSIIQLQQTIGNKAVVNMIQRQEIDADDKGLFHLEGMPINNEIQTKLSDKLLGLQGDLDEKWQEGDSSVKSGGDSNMMPGGDSGLK